MYILKGKPVLIDTVTRKQANARKESSRKINPFKKNLK